MAVTAVASAHRTVVMLLNSYQIKVAKTHLTASVSIVCVLKTRFTWLVLCFPLCAFAVVQWEPCI